MNELAERAARIGKVAAQRVETTYIAREWWSVRKPSEEPIEVFFCPAQTQAELMKNWPAYRSCGVLPL